VARTRATLDADALKIKKTYGYRDSVPPFTGTTVQSGSSRQISTRIRRLHFWYDSDPWNTPMNTKRLMIKGPAGNIPPLVDGLRAIAPDGAKRVAFQSVH